MVSNASRHGVVARPLLERRLEPAAEQQHDPGVVDLVDLVGRDLEVVGLGARRREVDHLGRPQLGRQPGQRVVAGHHLIAVAAPSGAAGGEPDGHDGNENGSHVRSR